MAVIMVLHSTLLYHTGRGPWWDGSMGIDRRNCRKYGWSNLLYISNWVNTPEMVRNHEESTISLFPFSNSSF